MTTPEHDPTRELALLAGEAFARIRLEPEGYRRIELEWRPAASFDFVYAHGEDVVLIDTLAADQVFDGLHEADVGSRRYVELVIANMRKHAANVAATIEAALLAGRLRYFEVRQPIDDAGELGNIEIRQFAL